MTKRCFFTIFFIHFLGHASLIGLRTNKILGFATRDAKCRQCDKNGGKPHPGCAKNHVGSAKSMESAMAVELVLKNDLLVKSKVRIRTLIGDDDSSSIAALRRLSPYAIMKWSDFNHVKKTFNSKLYDLRLTANLREYFSKMFKISIYKNKGNPETVKVALLNIVPHAFGDHSKCDGRECQNEKEKHVYKYFKDNQCLSNMKLKEKLTEIIAPFVKCSEQIAQCASSQGNESFNFSACRKHPKDMYFGGSESHRSRVAITTLQKNKGHVFIIHLNKRLDLSPGTLTEIFRRKRQRISDLSSDFKQSLKGKKLRFEYKKKRLSASYAAEQREGISYLSGSGYLDNTDLIDEVPFTESVDFQDCCIVYFDIETTGLAATDEIFQLSAVSGDSTFDTYIMPRTKMTDGASDVTGIVIDNNKMFHKDNMEHEILTSSPRDGLNSFLYFLKKLEKPCILVAHNGNR